MTGCFRATECFGMLLDYEEFTFPDDQRIFTKIRDTACIEGKFVYTDISPICTIQEVSRIDDEFKKEKYRRRLAIINGE